MAESRAPSLFVQEIRLEAEKAIEELQAASDSARTLTEQYSKSKHNLIIARVNNSQLALLKLNAAIEGLSPVVQLQDVSQNPSEYSELKKYLGNLKKLRIELQQQINLLEKFLTEERSVISNNQKIVGNFSSTVNFKKEINTLFNINKKRVALETITSIPTVFSPSGYEKEVNIYALPEKQRKVIANLITTKKNEWARTAENESNALINALNPKIEIEEEEDNIDYQSRLNALRTDDPIVEPKASPDVTSVAKANPNVIVDNIDNVAAQPRPPIIAYTEKPNIYAYPALESRGPHAIYPIGDLHASTMKLIYFATKFGVINIPPEDYKTLADIYLQAPLEGEPYNKPLSVEDTNRFKNIVNNKITIADRTSLILLIGDEVADRGKRDDLTLSVINKLKQANVIEDLISNHGIEFLLQHEKFYDTDPNSPTYQSYKSDKCETRPGEEIDALTVFRLTRIAEQASSMTTLNSFLLAHPEQAPEIAKLAESYRLTLKPVSYSLSDDRKHITLFGHAPIDIKVVKAMARKLNIPVAPINRAEDVAILIDRINDQFRVHLLNRTVHTLITDEALYTNGVFSREDIEKSPFEVAMWNRSYSILDREESFTPESGEGEAFTMSFVNGHDDGRFDDELHNQKKPYLYNIDNGVAKVDTDFKFQEEPHFGYKFRYAPGVAEHQVLIAYGTRRVLAPVSDEELLGIKQAAPAPSLSAISEKEDEILFAQFTVVQNAFEKLATTAALSAQEIAKLDQDENKEEIASGLPRLTSINEQIEKVGEQITNLTSLLTRLQALRQYANLSPKNAEGIEQPINKLKSAISKNAQDTLNEIFRLQTTVGEFLQTVLSDTPSFSNQERVQEIFERIKNSGNKLKDLLDHQETEKTNLNRLKDESDLNISAIGINQLSNSEILTMLSDVKNNIPRYLETELNTLGQYEQVYSSNNSPSASKYANVLKNTAVIIENAQIINLDAIKNMNEDLEQLRLMGDKLSAVDPLTEEELDELEQELSEIEEKLNEVSPDEIEESVVKSSFAEEKPIDKELVQVTFEKLDSSMGKLSELLELQKERAKESNDDPLVEQMELDLNLLASVYRSPEDEIDQKMLNAAIEVLSQVKPRIDYYEKKIHEKPILENDQTEIIKQRLHAINIGLSKLSLRPLTDYVTIRKAFDDQLANIKSSPTKDKFELYCKELIKIASKIGNDTEALVSKINALGSASEQNNTQSYDDLSNIQKSLFDLYQKQLLAEITTLKKNQATLSELETQANPSNDNIQQLEIELINRENKYAHFLTLDDIPHFEAADAFNPSKETSADLHNRLEHIEEVANKTIETYKSDFSALYDTFAEYLEETRQEVQKKMRDGAVEAITAPIAKHRDELKNLCKYLSENGPENNYANSKTQLDRSSDDVNTLIGIQTNIFGEYQSIMNQSILLFESVILDKCKELQSQANPSADEVTRLEEMLNLAQKQRPQKNLKGYTAFKLKHDSKPEPLLSDNDSVLKKPGDTIRKIYSPKFNEDSSDSDNDNSDSEEEEEGENLLGNGGGQLNDPPPLIQNNDGNNGALNQGGRLPNNPPPPVQNIPQGVGMPPPNNIPPPQINAPGGGPPPVAPNLPIGQPQMQRPPIFNRTNEINNAFTTIGNLNNVIVPRHRTDVGELSNAVSGAMPAAALILDSPELIILVDHIITLAGNNNHPIPVSAATRAVRPQMTLADIRAVLENDVGRIGAALTDPQKHAYEEALWNGLSELAVNYNAAFDRTYNFPQLQNTLVWCNQQHQLGDGVNQGLTAANTNFFDNNFQPEITRFNNEITARANAALALQNIKRQQLNTHLGAQLATDQGNAQGLDHAVRNLITNVDTLIAIPPERFALSRVDLAQLAQHLIDLHDGTHPIVLAGVPAITNLQQLHAELTGANPLTTPQLEARETALWTAMGQIVGNNYPALFNRPMGNQIQQDSDFVQRLGNPLTLQQHRELTEARNRIQTNTAAVQRKNTAANNLRAFYRDKVPTPSVTSLYKKSQRLKEELLKSNAKVKSQIAVLGVGRAAAAADLTWEELKVKADALIQILTAANNPVLDPILQQARVLNGTFVAAYPMANSRADENQLNAWMLQTLQQIDHDQMIDVAPTLSQLNQLRTDEARLLALNNIMSPPPAPAVRGRALLPAERTELHEIKQRLHIHETDRLKAVLASQLDLFNKPKELRSSLEGSLNALGNAADALTDAVRRTIGAAGSTVDLADVQAMATFCKNSYSLLSGATRLLSLKQKLDEIEKNIDQKIHGTLQADGVTRNNDGFMYDYRGAAVYQPIRNALIAYEQSVKSTMANLRLQKDLIASTAMRTEIINIPAASDYQTTMTNKFNTEFPNPRGHVGNLGNIQNGGENGSHAALKQNEFAWNVLGNSPRNMSAFTERVDEQKRYNSTIVKLPDQLDFAYQLGENSTIRQFTTTHAAGCTDNRGAPLTQAQVLNVMNDIFNEVIQRMRSLDNPVTEKNIRNALDRVREDKLAQNPGLAPLLKSKKLSTDMMSMADEMYKTFKTTQTFKSGGYTYPDPGWFEIAAAQVMKFRETYGTNAKFVITESANQYYTEALFTLAREAGIKNISGNLYGLNEAEILAPARIDHLYDCAATNVQLKNAFAILKLTQRAEAVARNENILRP